MKPLVRFVVFAGLGLGLAACAAGSHDAAQAAAGGPFSQFLLGLWHGIIAPVTLIIEIVRRYLPGVLPWPFHLYQVDGATVPYDIGFYLGLAGGPSFLFWRRP